MPDFNGWHYVLCDRWIDEVAGTRCILEWGHDGPCKAEEDDNG